MTTPAYEQTEQLFLELGGLVTAFRNYCKTGLSTKPAPVKTLADTVGLAPRWLFTKKVPMDVLEDSWPLVLAAMIPSRRSQVQKRWNEIIRVRNEIVLMNRGLVHFIMTKYSPAGCLESSDLHQTGMFGLMKAVFRFDHTRGFAFSTYAHSWIRHYIGRALANTAHTIRIPVHAQGKVAQFKPTQLMIEDSSHDKNNVLSVDAWLVNEQPSALAEMIGHETADTLHTKLDQLKPRLREVIEYRYFKTKPDGDEYTLKDIGEILGGLSRERIRQIEVEALKELRRMMIRD